MKILLRVILAITLFVSFDAAQSQTSWNWSYTNGTNLNASGTLSVAGNALTYEPVISITGTRNGVAITGMVSLTDPSFSTWLYDNTFQANPTNVSFEGLLFKVGNAGSVVNLYYNNGYREFYDTGLSGGSVNQAVSLHVTAVPEPETYALMLLGLGLVTFFSQRKRAQQS